MSPPQWLKETYVYKLFQTFMCFYLSKLAWTESLKYSGSAALTRQYCAVFMGVLGVLQMSINIGLIGDAEGDAKREKKQRMRREVDMRHTREDMID